MNSNIIDQKAKMDYLKDMAKLEHSDEELEGRSVYQEIDYSDRKKAMK